MPAPADHDARRTELADLAAELIAREGLDALSIRRLAAATGYSTTVVTHYFETKRALLLAVYRACADRAQARVDAAIARDPADLVGCLAAFLPIGAEARRDWRVNFAFWQVALHDQGFAEEQRWWTRHATETIAAIMAGAGGDAELLLTLAEGIAVRAAFEPDWTDERQRDFLRGQLERVAPGRLAHVSDPQ